MGQARLLWMLLGVTALFTSAIRSESLAAQEPGEDVTDEIAERWGCDPVEVQTRADSLRKKLDSGKVYIPRVDWTACELLARVGAPDNVDHVRTETSASVHWFYYRGESHAASVVLESVGKACADEVRDSVFALARRGEGSEETTDTFVDMLCDGSLTEWRVVSLSW